MDFILKYIIDMIWNENFKLGSNKSHILNTRFKEFAFESYSGDYSPIYDVNLYRNNIEHIRDNNYTFYTLITSIMHKRYDYIFDNINEHGIFIEYQELYDEYTKKKYARIQYPKFFFKVMGFYSKNEIDECKKLLKSGTDELLFDCMMDKYFEDFSNNVLINIRSIVELNKKFPILPIKRLEVYTKILNFFSLNTIEKKNLYNELNVSYKEQLYDDFRLCRDYIYNLYNESFIKLDSMDFVENNNVRVYKLNGQDFYIPIHMASLSRKGIEVWENKRNKDTISLSIISNEHLGTYRNVRECVAFGFNKINPNHIMHVHPEDSYSVSRNAIPYVNVLYAPEELINETDLYNEIVVIENENIIPDYLICYDEVIDEDYIFAKSMNIPIVLIDTKAYGEKIKVKRKRSSVMEEYRLYE